MSNSQYFIKKIKGDQRYKKRAEKLLFFAKVPSSFAQLKNLNRYLPILNQEFRLFLPQKLIFPFPGVQ